MARRRRPTKFTRETVDRLFEAIEAGLPYRLAAEAAGITYQTFNEWQQGRFPRGADSELKAYFSDHLTRAQGASALQFMKLIRGAAIEDWRAAAWILERRFPQDFGKQLLELSGPGGGPMQVELQAIQKVVLKALAAHPEARIEVAQALTEIDRGRSA